MTRRRGNGEGSIYQRPNGQWCATYNAGYDQTGRRRRRTIYGKNRQDVQDKLRKLTNEATTLGVEPQRIKVAEYLERWLTDAAQARVKITTYENYARAIRKRINPRIGGMPLAKLTIVHVQRLYAELARDGYSAESVRMVHAVLRRALRQAVLWRLIPYNVCVDVERPRVVRAEIQPIAAPQVAQLFAAAGGTRLGAICPVAVATGMRLGELFGLQWPDIDFDAALLMVRRSIAELNGRLHVVEPKTRRSRRRIDLPQVAIDALREHRQRAVARGLGQSPWVFCDSRGGILRRSHFHRNFFQPLLRAAGLPKIRFHDLRHTAATLLLVAGVHPKVVQERLGHSQISVTLDIYSHVLPTMQRDAACKLDGILGGAVGTV